MQEEGAVISGLLVGLNIIDCNFDLKGDSLDIWVSTLTYFLSVPSSSIAGFQFCFKIKIAPLAHRPVIMLEIKYCTIFNNF